jgi:predicted secreted Zn-dependent protease
MTVTSAKASLALLTAALAVAVQFTGVASSGLRVGSARSCARSTFHGVIALAADAGVSGLREQDDPVAYYHVFGNNPDQIRADLDACRPSVGGSGEGDGYTSWRFTWSIRWDGACRVSSAAVALHIGMALPSWTPSPSAQPGTAASWTHYTAALRTHEQGHVSIARSYARKLLSDLRRLPGGSCSTLLQSASSVANADISAAQAANDAYDARTAHGATQGATFP